MDGKREPKLSLLLSCLPQIEPRDPLSQTSPNSPDTKEWAIPAFPCQQRLPRIWRKSLYGALGQQRRKGAGRGEKKKEAISPGPKKTKFPCSYLWGRASPCYLTPTRLTTRLKLSAGRTSAHLHFQVCTSNHHHSVTDTAAGVWAKAYKCLQVGGIS